MNEILTRADVRAIELLKRVSAPLARLSIFVVFFWFGALKIVELSPAGPLIENLLSKTLPLQSSDQFIIFLGIYEMVTGLAFLLRGFERLAIALLLPHIVATILPLILLPSLTWQGFLSPTLEGQYIIKNLLIVALALSLAARIEPFRKT